MKPALLRQAGEALWGARWQSAMASALNVSDRTVRRWDGGEFAIADDIGGRLAAIVQERRADLLDLARELRKS